MEAAADDNNEDEEEEDGIVGNAKADKKKDQARVNVSI